MRLFINSGVCARKWNGNVSIRNEMGFTTLTFLNCIGTRKPTQLEIIIPKVQKKKLKKNIWIPNIKLVEESDKRIVFAEAYDPYVGGIYALLRSTELVPDDIFIPKNMKEKVNVIKQIRFWDSEEDLGFFKSNMYLVHIRLGRKEKLPIYLAYKDAQWVQKSIVFYRNQEDLWGFTTENERKANYNKEFISLSELI